MRKYNVLFIVLDTLRKDYAMPLEESLKSFGFVSYNKVIAPASWTLPSHASMFTGLYPILHKAHESKSRKCPHIKLKMDNLLNIKLQKMGFSTYLLSGNTFVSPRFGFKDFEYFFEAWNAPSNVSILSSNERKFLSDMVKKHNNSRIATVCNLISSRKYTFLMRIIFEFFIRRVINVPYQFLYRKIMRYPLDKGSNKIIKHFKRIIVEDGGPWFIFINFNEVHEPYYWGDKFYGELVMNIRENKKIDPNLIRIWKENYPKEVSYINSQILNIIKILIKYNLLNNTLIIITSDHGQLLGEYGRICHGIFLFDELLYVPLLVKYPKDYKIKQIINNKDYISLTHLYPFILSFVKKDLTNDSVLYSEEVFSESYGIQDDFGFDSSDRKNKNIQNLEKYRLAVYYRSYKGIFNVNDWRFEEIISYNPTEKTIDENIITEMRAKVIKFLKKKAVIPQLK